MLLPEGLETPGCHVTHERRGSSNARLRPKNAHPVTAFVHVMRETGTSSESSGTRVSETQMSAARRASRFSGEQPLSPDQMAAT
jgi:hypothetical protein